MTPEQKTQISRIAIIGAFIMAISCTLKITFFHFNIPLVSQWINVILNAVIVYGCYKLGKLADLSLSHRLLCGTAMIGYLLYGFILLCVPSTPGEGISASVLAFFILTLAMSVWFLFDLVRKDLKDTEEFLEQFEEENED